MAITRTLKPIRNESVVYHYTVDTGVKGIYPFLVLNGNVAKGTGLSLPFFPIDSLLSSQNVRFFSH